MKRKIALTLLGVLLLLAGVYFYVNKAVLPDKIKNLLIEKILEQTGRHATIRSVDFFLLKGFFINDLTIFERDLQQPPLATVKRLTFRVLYLPILQERKIVIPAMTIQQPDIQITRLKDNSWNFSDIIEKQKTQKPLKSPFSLFIGGVTVYEARLKFLDKASSFELTETLEHINIKLGISLLLNIKYSLQAVIPAAPALSSLSIEGQYDISQKKLSSQIKLQNIVLSKYVSAYFNSPNFRIQNGSVTLMTMALNYQNGKINAKGRLEADNIDLVINPDKQLKGNPAVDLTLQYDPRQSHPLSYAGVLTPNISSLTGIPYVSKAADINGKISFENDRIKTDSLTANILDHKVEISGMISDFSNPQADVRASSLKVDLSQLKDFLKPWLKDNKIEVGGQADVAVTWKGLIHAFDKSQVTVTTELNNATLNAPQLPAPLTDITGKISYTSDVISLLNINCLLADSKLKVSGSITDLAEPLVDIQVSFADLDLKKVSALFPSLLQRVKIKKASGLANMNVNYKGPADSFSQGQLHAAVILNNASFTVAKVPETITAVSGKIIYAPDGVSWEDLQGTFQNNTYTLNGKLRDFKEPAIEFTAQSQDLNVTAKLKASAETYRIISCKGQYQQFPFEIKGNVLIPQEGEPQADLQVKAEFDLKNLPSLIPQFKEKTAGLNPVGLCTLQGTLQGPVRNWRNWRTTLNLASPQISFSSYRLENISLKFSQKDREIDQCDLTANAYGGRLNMSLSSDLSDDQLPFFLTGNLEKINLALLKNDTALQKQNISGFLSGSVVVKGSLKNLQATTGDGSILVAEGHIWQINLMKGLGQFLFIPEFENITFNEAKGDFTVKNQKVSISSLELISPQAMLGCAGWVDFKGNIDLEIIAEFSEDMIAESASLKKTITAILTQGDAYLTIRITGTLKDPKYQISPTGILKKTKNLIYEGLKSIFE